jgi:hypothetical protein
MNGEADAGIHTLPINEGELGTGTYFAVISSGSAMETARVVFIRQ